MDSDNEARGRAQKRRRYLEEALAETYSQLRVHGFSKEQLLEGLKVPLGARYEVSITLLGEEVRGILLGPITVGV